MNVLAILQLANGIATVLPTTLDLALKLKQLLEPLGPDIQVNISTLDGVAISEDEAAMKEANDWLVAHGYPPMTPTPPPTEAPPTTT